MLIRLRLDLAFEPEFVQEVQDEAERILAALWGRAVRVENSDGEEEPCFIEVHKCFHDEIPPKSCEIIKRVDK